MTTVKSKINNKTDEFIEQLLQSNEIVVTNNVAMMKTSRKALSEATGRSTKTITRALERLEKYGMVSVEYRLGRNGGYVIKFNPEMFEFDGIDSNILTNPTKEDVTLINQVFSETRPHKVKGDMLTEAEYKRYKADQMLLEEKYREYNHQLAKYWTNIGDNMIPWEFFEQFGEDTDRYYKAYLLSKTYDTIAVAWDQYVVRMHEFDKETAKDREFYPVRGWDNRTRVHMDNYHSLRPFGWFGSSNWNTALRLVDYFENEYPGLNPVVYISALFEQGVNFQTWKFSQNDFTAKILFPHMRDLDNKRFKKYYDSRIANQEMTVRMYGGIRVDMLNNPRIFALSKIWEGIISGTEASSVCTPDFSNYEELPSFDAEDFVEWGKTFQHNYDYILSNLEINAKELDLSEREINMVMKFVSDNFAIAQGKLMTEDWLFSPVLALSMTKAMDNQYQGEARVLLNTWMLSEDIQEYVTDKAFPTVSPTGGAMEKTWGRELVEHEKLTMYRWLGDNNVGLIHDVMNIIGLAQQRNSMYNSLIELQVALKKASQFVKLDEFGLLDF